MSLIRITDLRPGDVGLGPIDGLGGLVPKLGQLLVDGRSWPEHAFMVVNSAASSGAGTPRIVQAMPYGAECIYMVPAWHFTTEHVFYRPPYAPGYATVAAARAIQFVGTPYSFLDYLSIALWHWRIRPDWLARYIRSTKHMICSQLVDQVLTDVTVHLFDDGRLPQDVTPAAMAKRMSQLDWEVMVPSVSSARASQE